MPPTISSEGSDCNIPIAGDITPIRDIVSCDDSCGAFEYPETLEEYKATLKHHKTTDTCRVVPTDVKGETWLNSERNQL